MARRYDVDIEVALARDPESSAHAPVAAHAWAWSLALVLACGASFPYLSRMMNANERPRLMQAVAIIDHGTLALDPVVALGIEAGMDTAKGQGGALYPNKPPGGTAPAVLAYAIQRAWCGLVGETPTLRGLTLLARLLGGLVPVLVLAGFTRRRLGGDAIARVAVLAMVLATPLVVYAHLLFSHALAALTLFVGVAWIGDAIAAKSENRGTLRTAALGGLAAGATVTLEYVAVFAALPIAVWLVGAARRGRLRTLALALAGALVPIAVLALYQSIAFGSPFATSYDSLVDPGSAQLVGHGLLGLDVPELGDVVEDLLSPWGGLFYFAPLVVLAPLAWRLARDVDPTHVRLHLAVLGTLVLATLCIDQAGGWRVGPRHVVLALPALAPMLAIVLRERGAREGLLAIVLGLALWSVVVNGLAANLFPHLVPTGNPLADQLWPLVRDGLQPYSVLDGFRGRVPLAGLVPVAITLAMGVVAVRPMVPVALRVRVLAGALVVFGAIGLAAWSVPEADDAAASLQAIESIWEPGARAPKIVPLR